jgi:hypothetical protein
MIVNSSFSTIIVIKIDFSKKKNYNRFCIKSTKLILRLINYLEKLEPNQNKNTLPIENAYN